MKHSNVILHVGDKPWYSLFKSVLLVCFLFMSSVVQAQEQKSITAEFKNEPLAEVLKKLEKLSSYKILFTYEQVQKYSVTASLKNVTILDALKKVLEGKPFVYSDITDGKYISVKYQKPEEKDVEMKTVTGFVVDPNDEPLPGVTVMIKGTTVGVATNSDGGFELPVPVTVKNPVLLFSCIGMKSIEVVVKNDKPLNVALEENVNAMDEVVVNGIYAASRNSYTGSVKTIKGDELLEVSQTNLFKALSVLVPGMRVIENNEQGSNPNYIPEIIIRGTTSLATQGELGLNAPLIIVDGVETTVEALFDMDMFDIERVDVLKDASATAIYGDRAANGVIVVERKKVKDSKLRLRYNFVPDVQFPDVSSFNLCDPAQKLELEKRWGLYDDKTGEMEEEYYEKLERVNRGVNTDWKSIPLRNSWSHSHSVSASGRGGGMDYSVTARFGDKYGVMKKDYRRNYGLGFYMSYYYKNKLTVSFRADFAKTDSKNSPYGSFAQWVILNPYDSPYDEYGELLPKLSYNKSNPMYDATSHSFMKTKFKSNTASLNLRWDILKGLFFTINGNLTSSDYRIDDYTSAIHSRFVNEGLLSNRGSYYLQQNETTSWQTQATLSFSHTFDEDGTVFTLNGGGSMSRSNLDVYSMESIGYLKPSMDYISLGKSYKPNSKPNGSNTYSSSVAVYGNANFIYKNRYFVDASFRSSATSELGDNERWTPYWSFGIGWNIHNENFIKNLGKISSLRLRGSLGYVGSGNFDGNLTRVIYEYRGGYVTGLSAVAQGLGNPDLKAQRTLSLNAGLTMEALDNRLEMEFDIYKQTTTDMLVPIGVPLSTGTEKVMANLGECVNWGYELSISGVPIKTQDWMWRITWNTNHTVNRITKISNALKKQNEEAMNEKGLVPAVQFEEGESQSAIYAVKSWGINPATGEEIFVKKDGSITNIYDVKDKVPLGDRTPKLEGSFYTILSWRNISVNAIFTYTLGGWIYNSSRATKVENIDPTQNVDVRAFTERWVKPGDVVAYPKGDLNNQSVYSSRFVEKRNEIYLSAVNLSYALPAKWVKKLGMKRLALGVGISDILRLSTVRYERGTSYPYMRGFNFMISPTF